MENGTRKQILEFLTGRPRGSTISEISENLDISRQTASKYLEVLKAEKKIDQREVGKAKLNYLSKDKEESLEAS